MNQKTVHLEDFTMTATAMQNTNIEASGASISVLS